jgi:nucleotidyltransferase/DNA polymerase involved in DNA repair
MQKLCRSPVVGKAGAAWGAAREASYQAFRKAGSIALIFPISLDVAEWDRDYASRRLVLSSIAFLATRSDIMGWSGCLVS